MEGNTPIFVLPFGLLQVVYFISGVGILHVSIVSKVFYVTMLFLFVSRAYQCSILPKFD